MLNRDVTKSESCKQKTSKSRQRESCNQTRKFSRRIEPFESVFVVLSDALSPAASRTYF